VYAYVASDTTTGCSNAPCTAIYQFRTDVALTGLQAPAAQIGQGNTPGRFIRTGAFDNAYWLSTPTSPTGFLYVCGSLSTTASQRPTLYRIPITANTMAANSAVIGPKLVQNPNGECSPITEVMNGANDYIFVSVPGGGLAVNGCTGACMYMFNLTGITWNTNTAATAALPAAGGTSGIVVDNVVSGTTGAAQVYYMTLTSPGTVVQASQAGLQ
jgi:hypothetical protein